MAAKKTVATQGELAGELDVTDRTIRHYLTRGMPGTDSRGRYNVERCRAWVAANIREREELDVSELKEALARAELAKLEEQAKKLKLEREIKEGELVYRADVVQEASEAFLRLKTRIEAFPDEMEMEIPVEVRGLIKAALANKVYLWLKELSMWADEPTKQVEE